eukprot:UN06692
MYIIKLQLLHHQVLFNDSIVNHSHRVVNIFHTRLKL